MAVSVTGAVQLLINVIDARSAVAGAAKETGSRTVSGGYVWSIATGTGTGQADKVWADTRSVATAATDVIDLTGVLLGLFGEAENFVKLRGVAMACAATNTTTLSLARPTANGALLITAVTAGLAALSFGGFTCWVDPNGGIPITAGTADLLNVINSAGATATYDIVVLGTSA